MKNAASTRCRSGRSQNILVLALVSLCTVYAPPARAQGLNFVAGQAFPAGTLPTSVAAGDFNGDGKPDIAVTNQNGLTILLNNGTGFAPAASYTVGTNPQAVAAKDFNGDGKVDLVVVNQGSGTISVLLGNGNGTFQAATSYPAGSNPRSVGVADFNGDGKADLAIVDSGFATGSGVSVLLGNGNGTFQSAMFFAAGSVSLSVAVGDFNADGKPDLAVANEGSDNISVLLGNGNGTFQTAVNISLDLPGISVSPTSLVAGDFNGDGHLDLAVATPNVKNIAVLLGVGNGTFQSAVHYALDDPNFVNNNNTMAAVDLNGDGALDLVLANLSSNHVTVLVGAGNGTFSSIKSYAAGPEPTYVAVADFNGDGKPDLVASNNVIDGVVTLLLGNGDGTLKAAPLFRSGSIPGSILIADLNGDGIPDIVTSSPFQATATGIGSGAAMLGHGDGTFGAPKIWSTSAGTTSIALGDFNRDGKLDLVETINGPGNGNVSLLLGNGDGTFQAPVAYSAGTAPQTVVVADLNGDGILDIVVGNHNSGNVSVLLGNGNGTFRTAVNYAVPNTGTPDSITIADFNGDGKPDLAVAISGINASSAAILLGNGDGTFQSYLSVASGFHSSATLSIVSADFNGDGKPDLAITEGALLSILIANGGGAFRIPVVSSLVGPGNAIVGMATTGDFNADGKADLAISTRDGISVLLGNGDGSFQGASIFTPFLGGAIAAGDVDGDGLLDIVAADSTQDQTPTDTIAVLRNTSGTSFTIDSSPSGLTLAINHQVALGFKFEICHVAPCTYNLLPGTDVTLEGSSYWDDVSNIYWIFRNWNDGGVGAHHVTVPQSAVTYTASFGQGFGLQPMASPAAGGTITVPTPLFTAVSASGVADYYYAAGTNVTITAVPSAGYTFVNWSGNVAAPNSASTTVVITGQQTVTANFSALVSGPQAPANVSPVNNASGVSTSPTFTWTAATGATSYDLAVGTSSPPSVVVQNVTTTTYTYTGPLRSSTVYYWYVVARNSGGTANSGISSFTTASGPGISDPFFFVTQLYRDLLNRDPEPGGLNYWAGIVSTGSLTRAQVAAAFFHSPEFEQTGMSVIKNYIAVLGRDPEYAGWLYWFTQIHNGASANAVLNAFIASPEFHTTYGSLSNNQFVTLVYQNVLGRAPDTGGLNYWLNQLNTGALDRTGIMASFIASPEFTNRVTPRAYANLLYMGFLRRSADSTGLQNWTNTLTQPNSLQDTIGAFITSPEYLNRF